MKKIVLILIMFLLTLTGCGKERIEDISKLELRDKKIYVIGEDKPYTGTFVKKFKNGNLGKEENYKNGLRHGKQETYHINGQLALLDTYKNGKLNGVHKSYYENGNLRTEGMYKDGKEDGISRMYYENGQLWRESKDKNGVQIAPTKWYDKNGNPKSSI
jgi:antitoxin component YwqK of YwqJK toxin-antitoxin module